MAVLKYPTKEICDSRLEQFCENADWPTAVRYGSHARMKCLLEQGQDPSMPYSELKNLCALQYAVLINHLDTVKFLIENGVNVDDISHADYRNAGSCSPLIISIMCGHDKMSEYLIGKGADIDFAGAFKYTPLMCAVNRKNAAMVKLLLEHDARLDLKEKENGHTVIQMVSSTDGIIYSMVMGHMLRKMIDIMKEN